MRALAADPLCGAEPVEKARRVLVDYGGPNVAKPMHVGHLRSSIIGESLKRLFRARGDTVVGDAHFGDWGFQMGLLIVAVGEEQPCNSPGFLAVGRRPLPFGFRKPRDPWPTWNGSIPWPPPAAKA